MNLEEATIKALEGKLIENNNDLYVYGFKEYDSENNIENLRHGIGYIFVSDRGFADSQHGRTVTAVLHIHIKNMLDLNTPEDNELFFNLVREYFGKKVALSKIMKDSGFGEYLKSKGYESVLLDVFTGPYYSKIYIVLDSNCIDIVNWLY